MKKKYKLKKWIIYVFIIICLITLIYSLINIIIWKINVDKNNSIKEEINNSSIKVNEDASSDEDKYEVDFNKLKELNNDTIAYLKVNNTNIDYVVVKGKDNSYYLTHNYNKDYNKSGWIFADYHNKFDGSDKNIVIYGHNTADGSMFGTLRSVYNKDWNDNLDNRIITLITIDGTYFYQIFSSYNIEPEDYYINTEFNSNEEYSKFLKTIKSRSFYNYNTDVNINDTILTLSSCTSNGTKRVVLHAKKIN